MELLINIVAENAIIFLTAITAGLLLFYTRETYLLRRESQNQTQSQLTPHLSLEGSESKGAILSNIGKGIALSVYFDETIQVDGQPLVVIPAIAAGEGMSVHRMASRSLGFHTVDTLSLPDMVSLTYKDVTGKKYRAEFSRVYDGLGVFKEVKQVLLN